MLGVYLQDNPKEEEISETPAEVAVEKAAVPEKSVLYLLLKPTYGMFHVLMTGGYYVIEVGIA